MDTYTWNFEYVRVTYTQTRVGLNLVRAEQLDGCDYDNLQKPET